MSTKSYLTLYICQKTSVDLVIAATAVVFGKKRRFTTKWYIKALLIAYWFSNLINEFRMCKVGQNNLPISTLNYRTTKGGIISLMEEHRD